ncbi:hypothetical protein GINT2_000771 [Glugoides intestinalis]
MKRIEEQVKNDDLDSAREAIEALELKLAEEPSQRLQEMLKTQITKLKQIYSERLDMRLEKTEEIKENKFFVEIKFDGSEKKRVLRGLKQVFISSLQCVDLEIVDCDLIETGIIECTGTIFLRNVKNATIRSKSMQCRVFGCKNILLECFSETGIFIQESADVRIRQTTDCKVKVYDFSSPFENSNYEILK